MKSFSALTSKMCIWGLLLKLWGVGELEYWVTRRKKLPCRNFNRHLMKIIQFRFSSWFLWKKFIKKFRMLNSNRRYEKHCIRACNQWWWYICWSNLHAPTFIRIYFTSLCLLMSIKVSKKLMQIHFMEHQQIKCGTEADYGMAQHNHRIRLMRVRHWPLISSIAISLSSLNESKQSRLNWIFFVSSRRRKFNDPIRSK